MNVVKIVFSPAGGTEKCARLLADGLGETVKRVDLSDPHFQGETLSGSDSGDTVAVIALPSYGGRVPSLAAERLRKVGGSGLPCVLLCVYGNRDFDDTLVEMEDVAREAGFVPAAAVAAVAEHSIMHQYATGRPDDEDGEALGDMGRQIAGKLSGPWTAGNLGLPGQRPYRKAAAVPLVPKPTKDCVGCDLCVAKCPARAISPDNPGKVAGDRCIHCMRCAAICPHHARKLNGVVVAAAAAALKKACSSRKECRLWL